MRELHRIASCSVGDCGTVYSGASLEVFVLLRWWCDRLSHLHHCLGLFYGGAYGSAADPIVVWWWRLRWGFGFLAVFVCSLQFQLTKEFCCSGGGLVCCFRYRRWRLALFSVCCSLQVVVVTSGCCSLLLLWWLLLRLYEFPLCVVAATLL
ncbi:hypothetical protein TSUD_21630 [Trifolium subterraneum]|uniref:Transmembrane protein n=1 Tax=Trifolium subterraneum TaxID=3900 RepID=A0A2Z6M8V5_TRISU|nr:hypothetical protein TSUD_21630 [Trifolium subterraneum]